MTKSLSLFPSLSPSLLSSPPPSSLSFSLFLFLDIAHVPFCAGCNTRIFDRFILRVQDKSWHAKCLRCSDCQCQLSDKCYSRSGQVFCKDDFSKYAGEGEGGGVLVTFCFFVVLWLECSVFCLPLFCGIKSISFHSCV